MSWAWNSAQAGSIINFQIKLSSSWLNALSWRFSSAQAGSTIELGWVSLSQVELAQSGSSWMPKKRGKNDIFGQNIWFFSQKFMKYQPSSSWLKEKQLQLNLAQLLSSRSSQLKLAQSLSWVEPAQAGSIWLNTPWAGSAQLSSKKPDRVSAQLNSWARCIMPAQRTLQWCFWFWRIWSKVELWVCDYGYFGSRRDGLNLDVGKTISHEENNATPTSTRRPVWRNVRQLHTTT